MSVDNFIASVWAGSILRNLHKSLVYGQMSVINRDYEGDIADAGDSVKINNIGPVTVGDYTKNTNITDPEALTSAQQALVITQSKFFNFQIDDVDKAQAKPTLMNEAMYEAGYALAMVADQFVASQYTSVDAANLIGSDGAPVSVTTASALLAYDQLVDLKTILDISNIPDADRWCIIPPWFEGLLLKDARYVSFGTPQSRATLEDGVLSGQPGATLNGQIGRASGFNVLRSNNVPNTANAKWKIIAGHRIAATMADQVNKTEAYRPPLRFADAVKGLHLYGAKLVRTNGWAVGTFNQT